MLGSFLIGAGVTSYAFKKVEESNPSPLQKETEGLYFVVSYKAGGSVGKQIICDYFRKDANKGEVVCREWKTNEYYIFSYPVSVTDVTLAKDYIKFTNEK